MRKSSNFELNLVEGADIVNPLVNDVPNFEKIDEVMKENRDLSISPATELLSGTVHAITRENPDSSMFRFVATSKFNAGETFTVDGVQVTALLMTGETLPTGAYVIGSNVMCCLVGTTLTIFGTLGGEFKSYDSERLNGKTSNYYASADDLKGVNDVAQAANDVAVANKQSIQVVKDMLEILSDRSCSIGLYGASWGLTTEYKNVGSNANRCPVIDNAYFKSTSGDDAYIELKTSGLYTINGCVTAGGKTGSSQGHMYGRIRINDNMTTVPDQTCSAYVYQLNIHKVHFTKTMYLEAGTKIRLEVSDGGNNTLYCRGEDTLTVTKIL